MVVLSDLVQLAVLYNAGNQAVQLTCSAFVLRFCSAIDLAYAFNIPQEFNVVLSFTWGGLKYWRVLATSNPVGDLSARSEEALFGGGHCG